MRFERALLTVIVITALLSFAPSLLSAAPNIFEGIDPGAGPASARPNSDAAAANFDAAAGSLGAINLINLETAPLGNFAVLNVAPGVTATLQGTDPAYGILAAGGDVTLGFNTTSGGARFLRFAPITNIGTARLIFNFNQSIQAFGTYITGLGTANGNLFVLFNDGSNQSIPVAGSSNGGAKFFGFTTPGAQILQVALELRNVSGTRDIFSVDDLRYVLVPEPSALTLACLSIAAGLSRLRRRR